MIVNSIGSNYSIQKNKQKFGQLIEPNPTFTDYVCNDLLQGNKKAIALWEKALRRLTNRQKDNQVADIMFRLASNEYPIIGVYDANKPCLDAREEFTALGMNNYTGLDDLTKNEKIRGFFKAMSSADKFATDLATSVASVS